MTPGLWDDARHRLRLLSGLYARSRIPLGAPPQLDTVIKLLPRLQYGLDVNVRFNSVRGFEFTEEMAAFDMTGITLLHGWLLDPEDKRTVRALH